jgi:hypothetical protein
MTAASLYSSNDEEDPWDQQKIKEEMMKLADYEIDPKDIEELVLRVTDSSKPPKIEIMNFAMQKIQQIEGRKSKKISNLEKDRIIMQFIKMDSEIVERSKKHRATLALQATSMESQDQYS